MKQLRITMLINEDEAPELVNASDTSEIEGHMADYLKVNDSNHIARDCTYEVIIKNT